VILPHHGTSGFECDVQQDMFLLMDIGARDVCSAIRWELRSDLVFCILYFVPTKREPT
jgi:hypothetical protein